MTTAPTIPPRLLTGGGVPGAGRAAVGVRGARGGAGRDLAGYADAGIPHSWILDVRERPSLLACHLAGEFGHADAGPVHGVVTTDVPFPVRLDLDALTGVARAYQKLQQRVATTTSDVWVDPADVVPKQEETPTTHRNETSTCRHD